MDMDALARAPLAADATLLAALADAPGPILATARLYDEARRRQDWLSASAEITSALLAADPGEALELVVRGARRVAGARTAWITLPCGGGKLRIAACDGLGAEQMRGREVPATEARLLSQDAPTWVPVVIDDATTDDRVASSPITDNVSVGPLMLIPLAAPDDARGSLGLANSPHDPHFSKIDVEMATTFAAHASLALKFAQAEADRRRLSVVEERDRIARDLHDVVIQRLFAITLRLERFGPHLPVAEARRLDATVEELNETIDDIRQTIFSLRADQSAGTTLRAEVVKVTAHAEAALGFTPRLRISGPLESVIPDAVRNDVLATLREALSNTARHAQATSVTVELMLAHGEFVLRVTDDGSGLPTERHESGLANLRHRAESLGGTMTVSERGRGMVLDWRLPINPAEPPAKYAG
ncbi:MAG TPA: GAF domain-containing sensor histidine kinase [Jatrophihabitantaceae bacterium]|jgi:signal transduction histidine kinase|nr:GAF domain-containing sensor histidine kinase [Jatrophihabitantaceae bacterium]